VPWNDGDTETDRDGENDEHQGSAEQGNGDGDEDDDGGDDGGSGDGDGDGDGGDGGDGSDGDDGAAGDGDGDGDGGGDGDGDGGGELPTGTPTEENLRVAFIGDQGTTDDSVAVLDLVAQENAAFLVIAGDFDYDDNPDAWDEQTTNSLGDHYPVFAVVGNHDQDKWDGANGYQSKVIARLQNAMTDGATCSGEPGSNSTCTYKGLFMAMSGVDVLTDKEESADYLRNQLASNDAIWSVCVWHKNMTDMQAGDKPNETGWGVYQACQDEAGIVITGHEHSYSRTLTVTDLGNADQDHGAIGEPKQMVVSKGSTYVTVTGLGGRNIRAYEDNLHDDDGWWASHFTSNFYLNNGEVVDDFEAKSGALFIDFNVDGDPNKAHAYFKTIDGDIIDEYDIIRE
jgi:predicted phosphodiesterase